MVAKQKSATPRTRTVVKLPQDISGSEASWPGYAGSKTSPNATLRASLTEDVEDMGFHSVRQYDITGNKEQDAFLTLFRSVVAKVHNGAYGVQAVKQDNVVIVRLSDPVTRAKRNGSKVAS